MYSEHLKEEVGGCSTNIRALFCDRDIEDRAKVNSGGRKVIEVHDLLCTYLVTLRKPEQCFAGINLMNNAEVTIHGLKT